MAKLNAHIYYGTRPEFIKLAVLIRLLQADHRFNVKVIHTGQHQDLTLELEKLFEIDPDHRFSTMVHGQSLGSLLSKVIGCTQELLDIDRPDLVIIQGDTTTVMGVALACFYAQIRVGHVEAGLRSFNLLEPFPEEYNRKITTLSTFLHFAPTSLSKQHLLAEGIPQEKIFITGNTVVDAALFIQNIEQIVPISSKKILITAHRRENHGTPLLNICKALKILASRNPEFNFVWPLHPNPNVKNVVEKELNGIQNISLIQPLAYNQLLKEIADSYLIWTDSGGIQEEVPTFKKPVLILRNVTERPEIVTSGFGILCGTDYELLINITQELIDRPEKREQMIKGTNPFGDGSASQQILDACYEEFKK